MVLRIAYFSSAASYAQDTDLSEILRVSRRNNSAVGVTGLLVAHEGAFFQVLEGPTAGVAQIMARIDGDPRHSMVTTVLREDGVDRVFGGWSMGFHTTGTMPDGAGDSFASLHGIFAGLDVLQVSAPEIGVLLKSFLGSFRDLPMSCGTAAG